MRKSKPIRVFWSPLSQRFYASRAYKEEKPGVVTITGEKFDVTDDIAFYVLTNDLQFNPTNAAALKEVAKSGNEVRADG